MSPLALDQRRRVALVCLRPPLAVVIAFDSLEEHAFQRLTRHHGEREPVDQPLLQCGEKALNTALSEASTTPEQPSPTLLRGTTWHLRIAVSKDRSATEQKVVRAPVCRAV